MIWFTINSAKLLHVWSSSDESTIQKTKSKQQKSTKQGEQETIYSIKYDTRHKEPPLYNYAPFNVTPHAGNTRGSDEEFVPWGGTSDADFRTAHPIPRGSDNKNGKKKTFFSPGTLTTILLG